MFMDIIGVPFNGKKQICRAMTLQEDYIFNPNELKVELNEKGWSKARETKGTITQVALNTGGNELNINLG